MKSSDFDSMVRRLTQAKAFMEQDVRDGFVIHDSGEGDAENLIEDMDLEDYH